MGGGRGAQPPASSRCAREGAFNACTTEATEAGFLNACEIARRTVFDGLGTVEHDPRGRGGTKTSEKERRRKGLEGYTMATEWRLQRRSGREDGGALGEWQIVRMFKTLSIDAATCSPADGPRAAWKRWPVSREMMATRRQQPRPSYSARMVASGSSDGPIGAMGTLWRQHRDRCGGQWAPASAWVAMMMIGPSRKGSTFARRASAAPSEAISEARRATLTGDHPGA